MQRYANGHKEFRISHRTADRGINIMKLLKTKRQIKWLDETLQYFTCVEVILLIIKETGKKVISSWYKNIWVNEDKIG